MMRKSFKILLVEDNPIDVLILKKTFNNIHADCSFTEFHDGEKALRYLENLVNKDHEQLPDMIITDLHLPKMTGHDLLAIIKEDLLLRTIPIVMFSNSSSETDIKLAYHLNVNSYIVKPLNLNTYKETISSFWNYWGNAARLPDPEWTLSKTA